MWRWENGVSGTATVATSWYLRATGSSRGNNAAAPPKWQRLTSFPCQETRTIKGSAWIPPGSTGSSVCCLAVMTHSAAFLISLQIKDGIGRPGMADPCGIARVWGPRVLTSDPSSAQSRPSNREYQPSQRLSERIFWSSNMPSSCVCIPPRLGCCPLASLLMLVFSKLLDILGMMVPPSWIPCPPQWWFHPRNYESCTALSVSQST